MTALKDYAICIGKRNYSESSQIVTLFGRRIGKAHAIAKGSRRPRGKFGGGIDMLTGGAIILLMARGESSLATLTEFELQESFAGLRRSLLGLNCAQYGAELLARFTEELDPHEQLYDTFYLFLKQLEQTEGPERALLNFELALLHEIGLGPAWRKCCICGTGLKGRQGFYFSSGGGGMLCAECERAVPEKRFVEAQALALLQNPQVQADRQTVLKAHELLSYHERELLGTESRIMVFVNGLLRRHSHSGREG